MDVWVVNELDLNSKRVGTIVCGTQEKGIKYFFDVVDDWIKDDSDDRDVEEAKKLVKITSNGGYEFDDRDYSGVIVTMEKNYIL